MTRSFTFRCTRLPENCASDLFKKLRVNIVHAPCRVHAWELRVIHHTMCKTVEFWNQECHSLETHFIWITVVDDKQVWVNSENQGRLKFNILPSQIPTCMDSDKLSWVPRSAVWHRVRWQVMNRGCWRFCCRMQVKVFVARGQWDLLVSWECGLTHTCLSVFLADRLNRRTRKCLTILNFRSCELFLAFHTFAFTFVMWNEFQWWKEVWGEIRFFSRMFLRGPIFPRTLEHKLILQMEIAHLAWWDAIDGGCSLSLDLTQWSLPCNHGCARSRTFTETKCVWTSNAKDSYSCQRGQNLPPTALLQGFLFQRSSEYRMGLWSSYSHWQKSCQNFDQIKIGNFHFIAMHFQTSDSKHLSGTVKPFHGLWVTGVVSKDSLSHLTCPTRSQRSGTSSLIYGYVQTDNKLGCCQTLEFERLWQYMMQVTAPNVTGHSFKPRRDHFKINTCLHLFTFEGHTVQNWHNGVSKNW